MTSGTRPHPPSPAPGGFQPRRWPGRWAVLRPGPALLGAALLGACAPDAGYQAPSFPFASRYQAAAGAPVLLSNDLWWRRLDDPALDRLVELALAGNPDLAAAAARVEAAEALLAAAGVTESAEASVGALVDREGEASVTFSASLTRVFDPGGALRAERRGALARAGIAEAERDAAWLRLLDATVSGYLDLRFRQELLALRRAGIERRRDTLATVRRLAAEEEATRLEVLRAEARLAEAEAGLPAVEAAIPAALSGLAVLAGRAPGGLPPDLAAALARPAAQPRAGLSPEVGVPADLLRNRPDLRLAERRYYAAVAGIGEARAALYPRLSLRGSLSVDALADGSAALALGPSLQLPPLPQGPARAAIRAREAEARAAAADWRAAVLAALAEMEAALLDHRATARAEEAAGRAARLDAEALALTRRLFELESATLGDLIEAESALGSSEERLAEAVLGRARAFAALNVRLGSGHQGGESLPPS